METGVARIGRGRPRMCRGGECLDRRIRGGRGGGWRWGGISIGRG